MDTCVVIKLEPADEILMQPIKIEPELQLLVAPVINPKISSPNVKKTRTNRKIVYQKCSLCSDEYETFKYDLKYTEVKSVCLVLGICSPNQCFEKLLQQDLGICESCTNMFKQINSEYSVLSEADRKIKECVKTFRQRLLDRQVVAANHADLGKSLCFSSRKCRIFY